jgi:rubrerythrin
MGDVSENLRAAFAGESQASRRYAAFAQTADKEGFPSVARLFRAAAQSETVHAIRDLNALRENRTTEDNLAAALKGETHEVEEMYPEFLRGVDPEAQPAAFKAFDFARRVEMLHAEYYKEARGLCLQVLRVHLLR